MRYRYPDAELYIGKIENGRIKKLEPTGSRKRTLFKWYDLEAGKYIVFVKIYFDPKF